MAIGSLQIPQSNINNLVDQSTWAGLSNLGNVYQKGQEQARQQSALAQLGNDPKANAQILVSSGVPSLMQLGLSYQEKDVDRAREDARNAVSDTHWSKEYGIRAAAASRAQKDWEEAEADRTKGAEIFAKYFGTQPPAQQPTQAPQTPFPAPLPGQQPPQAPPQAAPQAAPSVQPSAFGATPPVPAALQPPPVKAEGDDPSQLPSWVQSAQAQPPDTSTVGKITTNLVSDHPAAAADVSRDEMQALFSNPLTRPLAVAYAQKRLSPGEWKYEKTEDGRIIATNSTDPNKTKDVTPPTSSGEAPMSKQEREIQGYFQAGKKLGMTDEQANAFAANKGKTPSQDLRPGEETRVNKLTDEARTAQRTLDNVAQLRNLSKSAWGFPGADTASSYMSALPGFVPGVSGAVDTQDLINAAHNNVVNVARTYFPQRVTNMDVHLLQDLEGSANKSDAVRQRIYDRVEKVMSKIVEENNSDAEAIRSKTFYKPGGGPQTTPAAAAPPATTSAAMPSLKDFMDKARAANPGTPDSELAKFWKQKYGG
jgi:hypothetical protein